MTDGIDTSVAVRLLIGEPVQQAAAAQRLLAEGSRRPLSLSDLVVGETYFALRHHYAVPHRDAVSALRQLLSDRRVAATGAARAMLESLPNRDVAPGFMDRLIHAGYARDETRMVTFDRAAARLPDAYLLKADS